MTIRSTALPQPGSFWEALTVQARVIAALMLRELHTRYGRENIGYLWMVGEPMMLASVVGLMHLASDHSNVYGSDIKPLPFAVLGYTTFILFRGIVNRSEGALEGNAPLLYHRMVTVLDISLARALLEFAGCFLTLTVLMVLVIGLGYGAPPARPLYLVAAWVLLLWYSLGHSFLITGISHDNRTVGRFVHPYSYFMVGLSGAFFQVSWLPHPFREWIQWLPIVSIFELVRYGQFNSATLDYVSVQYVIGSCLVLTWVGMIAVRMVRGKIHLS